MSGQTIEFYLTRCRAEAFGPVCVGDRMSVEMSSDPLKHTRTAVVWRHESEDGDAVFFKLYCRRNLGSRVEARVSRSRAEREFDRLKIVFGAGVNCCEPLLAGYGRHEKYGRFEIIGTRAIPFSCQLKAFIQDARKRGEVPLLEGLFAAIRGMHRAGVYHGSLTPNNLVVSLPTNGEPEFYIVDFPRAMDFGYDIGPTRMAWYDIIHFMHRCSPLAGLDSCVGIMDHYDYSDARKREALAFLANYKPTKSLRYRLRNEFGFRALLSRPRL